MRLCGRRSRRRRLRLEFQDPPVALSVQKRKKYVHSIFRERESN